MPVVERRVIVQKYGGSSVADVERLGRVADRVVAAKRAGHDVVAVISAMGKSTDGLLALATQVAGSADALPRRELDMLLSTGERVSMALLSIAVQARGFDAISFTGSQCGILTNDRHFDARIIEVRPHRIEDELARGKIVIVAGYQGMSYRREITTLGRGGTDTTAVALAAALGAERCEIYSDVDGVYSADPRVVAEAAHLPVIDPELLQEMAEAGAKVLCAQAVEWARRAGIALYARSTFDESVTARQTSVRQLVPEEPRARAVVVDRAVALVTGGAAITTEAIVGACAELKVGARDLSWGPGGGNFVVSLTTNPSPDAVVSGMKQLLGEATVQSGLSMVSVVSDSLARSSEPMAQFLASLREAAITPIHLTITALRISVIVDAASADAAQRALHRSFVE